MTGDKKQRQDIFERRYEEEDECKAAEDEDCRGREGGGGRESAAKE